MVAPAKKHVGRTSISAARRGPVARPGRRPPGPFNLPVLGASRLFRTAPLQRFAQLSHKYGDTVYYRIGSAELFVLSYPEDIQSVLVGEHQRFMKDELTHELTGFVGRGLLTSEGRLWRRQRKIAAPSFQRRHIESFADTMVARTLEYVGSLGRLDGAARDIHADMSEVTLDIVLQTIFGEATIPDPQAVGRIVGELMADFQRMFLSWRRLLPVGLQQGSVASIERARAQLDEILFAIIRERRASDRDGDDLLGRLLAARDDDGSRMTVQQLRDEVATLFLAGHETTALTLSYGLLLLAQHRDVQEELHREVKEVLGSRPATMADVSALRLCDAVVRESMRLYPPAYIIGREALQDVEVGGWTITKGAQVLMPQWVVHRDGRWFDEPNSFVPQRWLEGLADRLPRFAYFPFGGGARVCVGNHFAVLEAVLGLATLVQHLDFEVDPGFVLEMAPSVTLRPRDGLKLRVSRRSGLRVA